MSKHKKFKTDNKEKKNRKYFDWVSLLISVLSLLVAIFSAIFTLVISFKINNFTMDNANLNYSLSEITDCKNEYIVSNDTIFSTIPITLKLERGDRSGKYVESYFSYIDNGEIVINEFKLADDNYKEETGSKNDYQLLFYMDMVENGKVYYTEGKESKDSYKCDIKGDNRSILFSNMNENFNPYGLLHVILKANNGTHQYFTLIVYGNGEPLENGSKVSYEMTILQDIELQDRALLQRIIDNINSKENITYKQLQNDIEKERSMINEKLNK